MLDKEVVEGNSENKLQVKSKFEIKEGKLQLAWKTWISKNLYLGYIYPRKIPKYRDRWEAWLNRDIEWEQTFQRMFKESWANNKIKEFHWKCLVGGITTEAKLKKFKVSDGLCKLCGGKLENIVHMLGECKEVKELWDIEEIDIDGEGQLKIKMDFIAGLFLEQKSKSRKQTKVTVTFYSCLFWEIWKRRNNFKFNNKKQNIGVTLDKAVRLTLNFVGMQEKIE